MSRARPESDVALILRDLVGFAKRRMSENAIAGIQSSPRLEAQQMGKLARVVDMSEQGRALLQQFHVSAMRRCLGRSSPSAEVH